MRLNGSWFARAWGKLAPWRAHLDADRGDVPGWVLVTIMTAGLVTGLWMVADTQLTALLTNAINSVTK
jgi:hypothetical protein